MIALEMFF